MMGYDSTADNDIVVKQPKLQRYANKWGWADDKMSRWYSKLEGNTSCIKMIGIGTCKILRYFFTMSYFDFLLKR